MIRLPSIWIFEFKKLGAFWKHDGNSKHPHALLTKGGHSDGFFNWNLVAQYPRVTDEVAHDIFEMLFEHQRKYRKLLNILNPPLTIVGPGNGAITLAHCLARELGRLFTLSDCRGIFTEKATDGSMSLSRFSLERGEVVIPCEDTITSGGSVQATIDAVENAGGICAPFILAVCNRSGQQKVADRPIIPLIEAPMNNWSPDKCPLCPRSEAIPPKKENWKRLTNPQD